MQLDKEKATLLNNAIDEWQTQDLITAEQSQKLKNTVVVRKFDWKQVTIYAFIIAVACCILSIIVLLSDKPLRELIEKILQINDFIISCILTVFTLLVFYYTKIRFQKHKTTPFRNQSFLLIAAFLSLASISYWAKTMHVFQNNYAGIFLLASIIYVSLAIYFNSQTIWVLSIIMLAFAYGLLTVLYSDGSDKELFLGMNFPFRFIPFSLVVLLFLALMNKSEKLKPFYKIHYIVGLLFFYFSLWLITIFGNYNSYETWNEVSQYQFIFWVVVMFVITSFGMYLGLKRSDFILSNISLMFFVLCLITRYFEYFWVPMHKSIFFMILAIIFWFVGSKAEKLWNLKFLNKE